MTGWVPQDRTVDPLLTTQENVTSMARMYHLSAKDSRPRAAELLRQACDEHQDKLARDLPGGLRRKLEVAMSLVNVPACCSSTSRRSALNISARRALWGYVRQIGGTGSTIWADDARSGRGGPAVRPRRDHRPRPDSRATGTPAGLRGALPGRDAR